MKSGHGRTTVWNIILDYKKNYMELTYNAPALGTIREQYKNMDQAMCYIESIC